MSESGDAERWGEESNIFPIRPQMMFTFEANEPIVDERTQEAINCTRYEMGYCRECAEPRGKLTPWCRDHYPWTDGQWTPMREEARNGASASGS